MRTLASGLRFPEGPVVLPDGSVLVVEIARGTLSRVTPAGHIEVVATPGGGPNGAAIGPDGACYLCNNGGFAWHEDARDGLRPVGQPDDYSGGRIERVDLASGTVETLYTHCGDVALKGPNDLVFDTQGGFYFTDLGKTRGRVMDLGAVYYAKADGSHIRQLAFPLFTPNGIGLSPDGRTLYVAETEPGRLWAFDLAAPGEITPNAWPPAHGGRLVVGLDAYQRFDSLAVEADGMIAVATLMNGGVTRVAPDGSRTEHVPLPDRYATNIAFGGPDLRTAFITLSSSGRLVSMPWPAAGLRLNHHTV